MYIWQIFQSTGFCYCVNHDRFEGLFIFFFLLFFFHLRGNCLFLCEFQFFSHSVAHVKCMLSSTVFNVNTSCIPTRRKLLIIKWIICPMPFVSLVMWGSCVLYNHLKIPKKLELIVSFTWHLKVQNQNLKLARQHVENASAFLHLASYLKVLSGRETCIRA